ncbi:MAG: hypothetical protein RL367_2087, partial [Pseudomonadota bacterium]
YWETRFPQLRPLTRAGNRRYYRPDDADLARKIDRLLNQQGYTFKGVQQVLAADAMPAAAPAAVATAPSSILSALKAIRDRLAEALADDAALA